MTFDEAIAQLSGPKTWCAGAAELARLDDPRAIVPILEAYRGRAEGGKVCLIEALQKLATEERVLDLYETGSRSSLLIGMYLVPSEKYLPLIEKAAKDPDRDVRWQARRALSNWKNTEAWRAVLMRLLNEGDVDARRCAVEGLRVGLKHPEVRQALEARLTVEENPELKERIGKELSK